MRGWRAGRFGVAVAVAELITAHRSLLTSEEWVEFARGFETFRAQLGVVDHESTAGLGGGRLRKVAQHVIEIEFPEGLMPTVGSALVLANRRSLTDRQLAGRLSREGLQSLAEGSAADDQQEYVVSVRLLHRLDEPTMLQRAHQNTVLDAGLGLLLRP